MKQLFKAFLVLSILNNCSSDPCSRDQWIGTYDKISEECVNSSVPFFEQTRTLQAGVCRSCLDDGSSIDLLLKDDCRLVMQSQFGDITMTLDDNIMTVVVPSVNCVTTYERR